MAIIQSLPGVEITIVAGGKPLQEYADGDVEDNPNSLRRYVEAVTGKGFDVRMKVAKGMKITRGAIAFAIVIDGQWVHYPHLERSKFAHHDYEIVSVGRSVGGGNVQKYCFSELETASDGRMKKDEAERAKSFSTISVRVTFNDIVPGSRKTLETQDALSEDVGIISEKAVKGRALTHGVGNTDVNNVFKVVFAYRSLKALKDMNIIEATPEPISLEERDVDSLTREDIIELQKRARDRAEATKASQQATADVKRERKHEDFRPRKVARPSATSTQLEIDEAEGSFREIVADAAEHQEPEVIEID